MQHPNPILAKEYTVTSNEFRTISRISESEFTAPIAFACIIMFPIAVLPVGPANTGIPVASAVSWFIILLFAPPPIICNFSIFLPVTDSICLNRVFVFQHQTVVNTAGNFSFGFRNRLICFPAIIPEWLWAYFPDSKTLDRQD